MEASVESEKIRGYPVKEVYAGINANLLHPGHINILKISASYGEVGGAADLLWVEGTALNLKFKYQYI